MKKSFRVTIVRAGSMCFIPVPFDPRKVFGKARLPVTVTLNGYSYRSSIMSVGRGPCIPLRRSNREAAGLEGCETLAITLEPDTAPRVIKVPPDLARALKATPGAWHRWGELSYTNQREYVEATMGAKRPETRARRIRAAVEVLAARRT
jgi:hypothetical protein